MFTCSKKRNVIWLRVLKKLLWVLCFTVFVKLSGKCQSVDELFYPVALRGIHLKLSPKIRWQSLPFIRHSDLAVMGWPRCNFSSEKDSPRCRIATSGYFENIQMPFLLQLSPHEEMPSLLPSSSYFLSKEAHLPLVLFATYLLLSPFTWVSTSTRIQKKPCPPAHSIYSPAGPLQSPAHQGLFWWHLIEQLLVSI